MAQRFAWARGIPDHKVAEGQAYRTRFRAHMAGLPQLSLPPATRLGAPLGLSLAGPPGSDRSLVALAQRMGG